jgi:micrococcal nuclease
MEIVAFLLIMLVVLIGFLLRRKPKDVEHTQSLRSQSHDNLRETQHHRPFSPAQSAVSEVRPQKAKGVSRVDLQKNIYNFPKLKVQHVIDGDTILVGDNKLPTKIRLDSIDCPEDGQPWGNIATAGLIKMIGGKHVRVETHGEDIYGRTLATIYVFNTQKNDWMNVNERMVTLGHAWVMRSFYDHLPLDRKNSLNRLESWSKSKNIGLWGTQNPTPPWLWRKTAPAPRANN